MSRWIWLVIVALLAAPFVGCDSEVTEADLDKWRYNERGLTRMAQFVADPTGSIGMRTRALEIIIVKNNPKRIRGMLDETALEDGREEIVKLLTERLLAHLADRDKVQVEAKDALLLLERYVSAPEFDKICKTVSDWSFGSVDWDIAEKELQAHNAVVQLSSGQMRVLGEYGYRPAAIILSRGLNVDKMLSVLTDTRNATATELLLKGMKIRHADGAVAIHHLDAIATTESGPAASYMLEMYLNEGKYDLDIRMPAFNRAMAMLDKAGVKKNPGDVVEQLFRLMAGKDDQDRWFGATNIIRINGVERLDDIMKAFKDDKTYDPDGDTHTKKWIVDFCLDVFDGGHAEVAAPIFSKHIVYTLPNRSGTGGSGNRIAAAISTVCLKSLQVKSAKSALNKLSRMSPDVSLQDFLGGEAGEYTLQSLATNAVEGLAMMAGADKDAAAGKLTKEDLPEKKKLISFLLELTGKPYATAVEERFAAYLDAETEAIKAHAAAVEAVMKTQLEGTGLKLDETGVSKAEGGEKKAEGGEKKAEGGEKKTE